MPNLKTCFRCERQLPLDSFVRAKNGYHGSVCKQCRYAPGGRSIITPEILARARDLLKEPEATVAGVAAELGVNVSTLYGYLNYGHDTGRERGKSSPIVLESPAAIWATRPLNKRSKDEGLQGDS